MVCSCGAAECKALLREEVQAPNVPWLLRCDTLLPVTQSVTMIMTANVAAELPRRLLETLCS
jgi:hypothetical protein